MGEENDYQRFDVDQAEYIQELEIELMTTQRELRKSAIVIRNQQKALEEKQQNEKQ